MARYTAEEFREMASAVLNECEDSEHGLLYPSRYFSGHLFYPEDAAEMLRHAADLMEREKRYEYAIIWDCDDSLCEMSIFHDYIKRRMDEINSDGVACHLVRREVGEWEEVEA